MRGKKRRAGVIFALVILCAAMLWNIVYIGVILLTHNGTSSLAEQPILSVMEQNKHLILNDMHPQTTQSTNSLGIIMISQNEIKYVDGFLIGTFFIYFIIATNVQDYNLFPSQAKLDNATRQKIYQLIAENEGIHLREICRLLDKKMGVVQYHLYILENANLISSMKDGRYKRFFVNHQGAPEERIIISLLKRETTAKVLITIYQYNGKGISHSSLAKHLKSSSQAITWHIHKLEDANVILTTKRGCQKFYQINPTYLPVLESILEKYS